MRRTLPEIAHRPVRSDLAEDLDLVVSELAGNALRHAGGVARLGLDLQTDTVLVTALSTAWSTDHDLTRGGKQVWAELAL